MAIQQKEEFEYVSVSEVSEAINSPKHFTAKILQQLSKAKLIESQRGPNGGFYLPMEEDISLIDIIRVIDGNRLFDDCILGFKQCSELHPCPMHTKFNNVREYLKGVFMTTDLEEMKQIVKNDNAFLKY